MRNIQAKKGMSIGDMYPAILTIMLVGLVLGIGLFILSTLHTSIATDYSGSQNSINASAGTTTLTDAALTEFNLSSIDTATNQTGTAVTNYTYTGAGVITWGSNVVTDSATDLINLTYTYTYDATDSPEESITTTITGLATFADWIAIIVVVIAAAIVLGIVLTSFGTRRNRI